MPVCGCGTSDVAGTTDSRSCAENSRAQLGGSAVPTRTPAVEATMQGSTEPGGAFGPKRQANAALALAEQERASQARIDLAHAARDEATEGHMKERRKRREIHNKLMELQGNIRVVCRARPRRLATSMVE